MLLSYDRSARVERVILHVGEYVTTETPRLLCTVLGSCVAVCVRDSVSGLAGMNHYLLPEGAHPPKESGRFAEPAIVTMIDELRVRGARLERVSAKLVGGANAFNRGSEALSIGQRNVEAAETTLGRLRIPIAGRSVGGRVGRRVVFSTSDGRVFVTSLPPSGVRL